MRPTYIEYFQYSGLNIQECLGMPLNHSILKVVYCSLRCWTVQPLGVCVELSVHLKGVVSLCVFACVCNVIQAFRVSYE